jgi:hypothetical protein
MEVGDVIDIHLEEDLYFAIAVGIEAGYTHCSIIYKWNDKIKTIDFYLGKIRNYMSYGDLGNLGYVFVKYNREYITDDFAIQIPSLCELIVEKNNLLNFGITFNNSTFDNEGNLKLQEGDFGLTCSTFILSIFESVNIPLIEFNSWEQRKEDILWHEMVLDFFVTKNQLNPEKYSKELVEHFKNNAGCFRYRPEDVAVATSNNFFPSNFDFCNDYGERLIFAIKNSTECYNNYYLA